MLGLGLGLGTMFSVGRAALGAKSRPRADYGKKETGAFAKGTKWVAEHADKIGSISDTIGSVAGTVGTVAGIAAPLAAATGVGAPLAAGLAGLAGVAKTVQGGAALVSRGAKTAKAGAVAAQEGQRAIDDLRRGNYAGAFQHGGAAVKSGKTAAARAKEIQRALK